MSPVQSPRVRQDARKSAEFARAASVVRSDWDARFPPQKPLTTAQKLDEADASVAIAHADSFGDRDLRRTTMRELRTVAGGALPGATLHERWMHYLAWLDRGEPARMPRLNARERRTYRELVRIQVETALREGVA